MVEPLFNYLELFQKISLQDKEIPGSSKTELWNGMTESDREEMYTNFGNELPVKRVGEAGDIARAFVYLLEQEYGTGQTLIIDGGTSLV